MSESQTSPSIPKLSDDNVFRLLDYWVAAQPDVLLFSFIDSRGAELERFTYQEFSDAVNRLSAHIQQTVRAERGAKILLSYQPGLELVCALFACNKAGFVGVPTLPLNVHQLPAWLYAIRHILDDSQAAGMAMCSTTWKILDACQPAGADGRTVRDRILAFDPLITTGLTASECRLSPCEPCDIFFLQYTSGSIAEPKGVMVSHSNLIANAEAVVDHSSLVAVSWLPQHHDMGLIGYYINIVLCGGSTHGFAPESFIKRPALWFETISRHSATATSVPNFALELCLSDRRVPQSSLQQFDLSALRILMVAAEPVDADNFFAFLEKFTPCGLQPESMFVAYGLAEFTLAVSSYGRRSISLDRSALDQGVVESAKDNAGLPAVRLMSCGQVLGDTRIEIVNPANSLRVGKGRTGEVWLSGKSKTPGYWNNPALNRVVFEARLASDEDGSRRYLRTGDIGFVDKGELFICGRLKDMLIIHGRNIYPQDIEKEVQKVAPKIRRNGVVAFVAEGTHDITVLAELVRTSDIPDSPSIIAAIRDSLQIAIRNLVFLAPRSIARTSSGKVRRARTRQQFEQARLDVVSRHRNDDTSRPEGATAARPDELESLSRRYGLTGDEEFTLFDAGIDSLDLIVLLHWLREECDRHGAAGLAGRITVRLFGILTVKQVFGAGRLLGQSPELAGDALAEMIKQALNDRIEQERQQMKAESVYQGAAGSALREQAMLPTRGEGADILLTGGTGFLGPFLLQSLIQRTEGDIHVLVRGENQTRAEQRLRREFTDTLGPSAGLAGFDARVRILCSELSTPRFGLQDAEWEHLAGRIGTIYHNGALVNYLLDYEHMRATNVSGTAQVIDFALAGRRKVLNHVSTTFVFGWATKDVLYESDQNSRMDHLDFGYSQSKWVAEQLVLSAMTQGLEARIFRPALIAPALDGRGGNLDIALRLLAFMVKHGVSVDTQNQVSFMPADVTANNIIAVASQAGTINQTFHVTRDRLETMPQITAIISDKTGVSFEALPLRNFVPEVIGRCTREDSLYPLLDFLVGSVDNIAAMEYKLYDNSSYRNARDQCPFGMQDPPLNEVVAGIVCFLERNLLRRHVPAT